MERCIYKYIHYYLLVNGTITPHQSGFTRDGSVIKQLLFITNEFGKALDEGKEIMVILAKLSTGFGILDN